MAKKKRNYGHTKYVTKLVVREKKYGMTERYEDAIITLETKQAVYAYINAIVDPEYLREFSKYDNYISWEKEVEI